MTGAATSESKRYIAGPMVELGLPFGFGVEFEALYSREGYRSSYGTPLYSVSSRERANSWEFPLLLHYRIPVWAVKPYVEVGYAPRLIHGFIDSDGSYLSDPSGSHTYYHTHASTDWQTSHGLVVGGGVQFGFARLRISPEVRYTHWNNTAIYGYYPDGPAFQSTQNQFEVLVGVGWKVR